jgi:GntR family transcriptional repressor for pyruvate dehydrogenase complex
MLENLTKINIEKPVDKIINQIRTSISNGDIKPGDKLPPERKLSERLGVSRGQVREAIQKLEFYGILKTLPQSGTIVAGIGIAALEGLITDVLQIEEHDFKSLVETRILLEKQTARLAASRRTDLDIKKLKNALAAYELKIEKGETAVEEDLLFHIKIAEAGKNKVLKSLMMIITPDIVSSFNKLKVCSTKNIYKALDEHKLILKHIIDQNPDEAAKAMGLHLKDVLDFSVSRTME